MPRIACGLILAVTLGGCATRYSIDGEYRESMIGEAREASTVDPWNWPILGLRFPALIDSTVADAAAKQYRLNRHYGRPASPTLNPEAMNEHALQLAMGKTLFYALQFQRYLSEQLPEIDTVLIPATIDHREGKWVLESNESTLAPWLVVDFFAYVHPYPHSLSYSTFGRHVAPMIWIRTDPMVSPGTRGAIAGDYFLRDMASAGTGDGAWAGEGATIVDLLNSKTNDPRKLTGFLGAVSVEERPWRPDVFLTMPVVHLELDSEKAIATGVKKYAFPDSFRAYPSLIRDAVDALLAAGYEEAWLERYAARYQGCSAKGIDAAERDLLYRMRVAVSA